ncbi:hypothetical protein K2173_021995 [Erythroxylum novogranatense]|uniref:Dof-type domain-containing protein n=1 Tax=Erythroxylum novogranatense TaxID=1862640 RepID=A0AAV8T2I0_9ROSI|nr:hypothetical protein K2173_021995 [Erythroxylum novogranatense]
MSDFKDAAIKLFGKTIPILSLNQQDDVRRDENGCFNNTICLGENVSEKEVEERDVCRESSEKEIQDDNQEDGTLNSLPKDSRKHTASAGTTENPKTPSVETDISLLKRSEKVEECETSISQDKTLKKPDKILPCPRCNSTDTKFCYYNNYNVNQPRHFCKNCQRYWTAGGAMRNVPVGAGRRKNKSSSASHYRQIMLSDGFETAQVQTIDDVRNSCWGSNGTVLTFGSDSRLCQSVASILCLSEQTPKNGRNGYHRTGQNSFLVSCGVAADIGDDHSSGSSWIASNSSDRGSNGVSLEANVRNFQGFPTQVSCSSYLPWNLVKPQTSLSSSGFPVPFFPEPTYWGCSLSSPRNVPSRLSLPQSYPPSTSPTSPLGKHSRDGSILNSYHSEHSSGTSNSSDRSVVAAKTLRIDDPNEAAKSSIWATHGIKNERSNIFINGGDLFKGFQSKTERTGLKGSETSSALLANPAALSRYANFQELT